MSQFLNVSLTLCPTSSCNRPTQPFFQKCEYIIFAAGRGLRVAMAAPALGRRRSSSCLRTAVFLFLVTFVWLQLHVANLNSNRGQPSGGDADSNDSTAAILSMVPQVGNSGRSKRHSGPKDMCCFQIMITN